jgi:hypothetical protein
MNDETRLNDALARRKHKRVVSEWVVTASGPGAFEWGFYCHRCDMHVERLTAEEARAIAGEHAHRVEAGCGLCRDGMTAEAMLAEGLTLCRSCHDAVSELLAPVTDEAYGEPYPELSDAEEAAEERTWD